MIGDLDWRDERYTRFYLRDTADWLALTFFAKSLYMHLRRKVDRAGVLHLGQRPHAALAAIIGHPELSTAVGPWLKELVDAKAITISGNALVVTGFIESEEAISTTRLRQAESRARRRDLAVARNTSQLNFLDRPADAPLDPSPESLPGVAAATGVASSGEITSGTSETTSPAHATDMSPEVISRNDSAAMVMPAGLSAETLREPESICAETAFGEAVDKSRCKCDVNVVSDVAAPTIMSRFVTDPRGSVTRPPRSVTPSVPSVPERERRADALVAELLGQGEITLDGHSNAEAMTDAGESPMGLPRPARPRAALRLVREGSVGGEVAGAALGEPVKPEEKSDSAMLEQLYREEYARLAGEEPMRWGVGVRKNVRRLLDARGYEKVAARLKEMYAKPPGWLVKDGRVPDIGVFVSCFDKLAPVRVSADKKPTAHRPLRLSE